MSRYCGDHVRSHRRTILLAEQNIMFNELQKYFKFTILLCSKALGFEILSCWNTRSENYLTEAVFVRTVNKVSPFPGR